MRVKFVPPKRKPKSSSKPASSTATVRRLPRRSPAGTKTGSIRNLPAIASAKAEASAKAGRNRPSRSSLLDTRVIFCGDNLRPCAPFVVRSAFRVPHSALTRLLPPLPQGHHPPDRERNPRRRNRQKTGIKSGRRTSSGRREPRVCSCHSSVKTQKSRQPMTKKTRTYYIGETA